MNQYHIFRKTVAVALVAAACVGLNAKAADLATGSELHADISSLVVAAKSKLAEAASMGDINAAKEAASRSQLIDDAMAKATDAMAALEKALNANDDDAAASAFETLQKAGVAAVAAITGPIGDSSSAVASGDDDSDDEDGLQLPNIFEDLWKSDAERDLFEKIVKGVYDASGGQFTRLPGEQDNVVTPI